MVNAHGRTPNNQVRTEATAAMLNGFLASSHRLNGSAAAVVAIANVSIHQLPSAGRDLAVNSHCFRFSISRKASGGLPASP